MSFLNRTSRVSWSNTALWGDKTPKAGLPTSGKNILQKLLETVLQNTSNDNPVHPDTFNKTFDEKNYEKSYSRVHSSTLAESKVLAHKQDLSSHSRKRLDAETISVAYLFYLNLLQNRFSWNKS